jgi:hypothetical protein
MAKPILQWFDADGTSALGSPLYLGVVGPGQSYAERHEGYRHIILRNVGDLSAEEVELHILDAGTSQIDTMLRVALGAAEAWVFIDHSEGPLALGTILPGGEVSVQVDAIVPTIAARAEGGLAVLAVGYVDGVVEGGEGE